MEEITIYKFQLETIKEALRLIANTYNCKNQETCLDRIVMQAEKYAENALNNLKSETVLYNRIIKQ